MLQWWQIYLVIFSISGILALVLTPFFQRMAEFTGFVDSPGVQQHKKHGKAVPLLGGPAIFLAWTFTIGTGYFASDFLSSGELSRSVAEYIPKLASVSGRIFYIFIGALVVTLAGLYDDRFNMSAKTKLLCQIIAAVIAVSWGGVRITLFFSSPVFSYLASIFWILLIINAINFFDNMDGLAAGTAAITLSLFTISAAVNQQFFVAAMGAAATGAAIGFWFYNHSPAMIFMGDSGSHFLGYIIAVISAGVTYYNPETSTTRFPVLIPLFILAIPLFDTLAVCIIRIRKRKPVYVGDHNHISHRFLRMGMSRKSAVFLVHLLELIIGLSVLPLMWGDEKTSAVSIIQACTIILFACVIQYTVITEKENGKNNSE